MTNLSFGRTIHFRPVSVRYRHGHCGGPACYVRTDSPDGGPLILTEDQARILTEVKAGRLPLRRAEELLDWLENNNYDNLAGFGRRNSVAKLVDAAGPCLRQ